MRESALRELIRFNDLMKDFIPWDLWIKWAEINDEIIIYLQNEIDKEREASA